MPAEVTKDYQIVFDESTQRYLITVASSTPIPEGKAFCRKCSKIVDADQIISIKTEWGKTTMCKDCYEKSYEKCPICGKSTKKEQMETFKLHDKTEVHCCNTCRQEKIYACDDCGKLHLVDSPLLVDLDGRRFCKSCFDKKLKSGRIIKCPDCGEFTSNPREVDDCKKVCPNCHHDYIPINEYSYKPKPKFKGIGKTYYGFELEVQCPDGSDRSEIAKSIRGDGLHYCKHDGSIGYGFEIVSHPFTEEWFYKNPEIFEKIWKLREKGCDGFHNNMCGMHVHITKEFTHLEIYKMMKIMYSDKNYSFWKKISRRRENEYDRWCGSKNKNEKTIKNEAKTKGRGDNKYTALNMTQKTIECRIFRSTLSKEMFYGNIEMMFALTNFVKSGKSLRASALDDFQKYIYDSKYEFAKKLIKATVSKRTIATEA